jgi:uncharacterized protein (TIRG00374 family)
MRKFFFALAVLFCVIFLLTRTADLSTVIDTLRDGDWRFIVLALGVIIVWLFNVAGSYWSIYRSLGLNEKTGRLLLISASANFVNVIAPSAGMGSIAVLISEARREGYSSARVTVAGGMFALFEYLGFLCVLALGLFVLFRRDNLNMAELSASAFLALAALFLAILIILGARSAESLGRFLAWMTRPVNRVLRPFIHRDYISASRAHAFAFEAADGLKIIREQPKKLLLPAVFALSSKAILILVLFLMFLAFNVPYSIGTLVAGFSIGYLFFIVSPTPAGIGIVEGALVLALRSLHVPIGAAAVIALAYRGITFWFPLLFGMLAFRWLTRADKVRADPVTVAAPLKNSGN